MDQILQGLSSVACYLYDILVAGSSSRKEHDECLGQVLKCLEENGIHFQGEKCDFCKTEVEYLGDHINAMGTCSGVQFHIWSFTVCKGASRVEWICHST